MHGQPHIRFSNIHVTLCKFVHRQNRVLLSKSDCYWKWSILILDPNPDCIGSPDSGGTLPPSWPERTYRCHWESSWESLPVVYQQSGRLGPHSTSHTPGHNKLKNPKNDKLWNGTIMSWERCSLE